MSSLNPAPEGLPEIAIENYRNHKKNTITANNANARYV